jgi:ATP-dependent RNA helicase DeaD
LESAPEKKRVLLFSATMPKAIKDIVKNYMVDHEVVAVKKEELTNKNIVQKCYKVNQGSKFDALCRVIETEDHFYGLVFCRTKAQVDEVASSLM